MFARTPRLTLRPGWPEDAPALASAMAHESVVTRLARAPWPYTEADAHAFLTRPQDSSEVVMLITVLEHDAPRIVGGIGIHRDGEAHELGYWLTPDAWGRGYATEAGRHMLQIARYALGLKRLNADHHVENLASARVLAKLGFTPTGRIEQQHSRARGHTVPTAKLELDLDVARAIPLAA